MKPIPEIDGVTSIFTERIRALLDAETFISFVIYLADPHPVVIIDAPTTARLENDGRALVVEIDVHGKTYLEIVDVAAITRLSVRAPAPNTGLPQEQIVSAPDQTYVPRKTRVLFICTHNSARSQMAEAWLKHLGGERIEAESAGYEPGELHPLAVEAMREVGIDMSAQKTKSIFELYRSGAMFTFTICVCDDSAEKPPIFPGKTERLHWSFPDPLAGGDGSEADTLHRMRSVRDALRERIGAWISATLASPAPTS